jgi:hypothetical protein
MVTPAWPAPPSGASPRRLWSEWVALAGLGLGIALVVVTGVAAWHSERAGVLCAYITAGPFFFGVVGTLVGSVVRRAPRPWPLLPLLWGGAAGLIAMFLTGTFLVVIFPRL